MIRDVVIGLDLATQAGWAVIGLDGNLIESGTWDTKSKKGAHPGERWINYRAELLRLLTRYEGRIALVAMEAPITYGARGRAAAAARVSFGQASSVEEICARRCIPVAEYPPSKVKKAFTGNGSASKAMVIAESERRFGQLSDTNPKHEKARSDEADARAVAWLGLDSHDVDALRCGELDPRER